MQKLISAKAESLLCAKQKSTILYFNKEYHDTAVVLDLVKDKNKLNPIQIVVKDNMAQKYIAFLSLKNISGVYMLSEFDDFDTQNITETQKEILIRRTNVWSEKVSKEQESVFVR